MAAVLFWQGLEILYSYTEHIQLSWGLLVDTLLKMLQKTKPGVAVDCYMGNRMRGEKERGKLQRSFGRNDPLL